MIIVKTEDISSAIKQAKVMIKPGSLVLENSLRFSAKKINSISELTLEESNLLREFLAHVTEKLILW